MRFVLSVLLVACAPTTTEEQAEDWEVREDTGGSWEAQPEDDARIVAVGFPAELACGQEEQGLVVVENTGRSTWKRDLGFKLGAVNDEDPIFDSNDVRVWLGGDEDVAPGEQHAFTVDLLGTDQAEFIQSDWQMVREGVHWFGEIGTAHVRVICEDGSGDSEDSPTETDLPLPDMSHVVDQLASERPDLLADSCLADGGSWGFLDELVDRLRQVDDRWGYNWKRGVEGDASQDVVDYHYGHGTREGSTEVYIVDVIVGHCGPGPGPGWIDQTQPTADAGTIGKWTGRGRF
jgi:hypothetical protein